MSLALCQAFELSLDRPAWLQTLASVDRNRERDTEREREQERETEKENRTERGRAETRRKGTQREQGQKGARELTEKGNAE